MSKYSERFHQRFEAPPEYFTPAATNISGVPREKDWSEKHLWKVGIAVFFIGFFSVGAGMDRGNLGGPLFLAFCGLLLIVASRLSWWARRNEQSGGRWNQNAKVGAKIYFGYRGAKVITQAGVKVAGKIL